MAISIDEVTTRVTAVVKEVLHVSDDSLVSGANFRDNLGADSLDMVSLVMALEEEFGESISDEDAAAITTVGEAVTYIHTRAITTATPAA